MKKVKYIKVVRDNAGLSKDGYDYNVLYFDEHNNLVNLNKGEEYIDLNDNKIHYAQ